MNEHVKTVRAGELKETNAASYHQTVHALKEIAMMIFGSAQTHHDLGLSLEMAGTMREELMQKIVKHGVRSLTVLEGRKMSGLNAYVAAVARLLQSSPQFGTPLLRDQFEVALGQLLGQLDMAVQIIDKE